jgi:hypothetical protein
MTANIVFPFVSVASTSPQLRAGCLLVQSLRLVPERVAGRDQKESGAEIRAKLGRL